MSDPSKPPPTVEDSAGQKGLQLADGIGIFVLVSILLVLSYFRSRHSMFWSDEIMGILTLRQPNLSSLLHAWRDGIDSSGIFFYVFGRPWTDLFGTTEVTLRMYSACGIAASAVVIWIAARRLYSFLPVAASVSLVYASTLHIRWQLANGRTYGVFLTAVALVIYLILRGEDADTQRPRAGFLLATLAAYSLLMGGHILGVIYVVGLLGMQIGLDLYSRRFRLRLYLAALCSFAILLFSRANIRATTALGKPTFWTLKSTFRNLITFSIVFDHRVSGSIVLLLLLLLVFTRFRLHARPQIKPVYALFLGYLALNIVIFAYSRVSTSIYVERYFLPFVFPAIFLLCELMTQLRDVQAPMSTFRRSLPIAVIAAAVAGFFVPRLQRPWLPVSDYTGDLLGALPPEIPLVDTDTGSFVEMEFYRHDTAHRRILYPVDWEVALDPTHPASVSGPHEMDNFKAERIDAADILPTADILSQNHDFAVFAAPSSPWMERRIFNNPNLVATLFGTFTIPLTPPYEIWLVHTR